MNPAFEECKILIGNILAMSGVGTGNIGSHCSPEFPMFKQ